MRFLCVVTRLSMGNTELAERKGFPPGLFGATILHLHFPYTDPWEEDRVEKVPHNLTCSGKNSGETPVSS